MTRTDARLALMCIGIVFAFMGARGHAQEASLRIASPVSGEVVPSGRPLRIEVAADDSVRMVYVVGSQPLPGVLRAIGKNLFEMEIPKTVPPGKYQLTAMGATSEPVFSLPVEIQIEREDLPVALKVPPLQTLISTGFPFPIFVEAQFADGSKLDVTHSMKTTFESRNPAIVIVDEQRRLVALGSGETTILIGYAGQLYTTVVVNGPGTALDGKLLPSYRGIEHADGGTELHERTAQSSFAAHPSFKIDAVLGAVTPGKVIRIVGSGFTSERGTGFVTVAGVKAEVVTWTTKEITVTVPQFTTRMRMITISVHQDDAFEDFPVRVPLEVFLHPSS